jgi:hypothetical protein
MEKCDVGMVVEGDPNKEEPSINNVGLGCERNSIHLVRDVTKINKTRRSSLCRLVVHMRM